MKSIYFQNLYTFQLRVNRTPELQTETDLAKIPVGKVREQSWPVDLQFIHLVPAIMTGYQQQVVDFFQLACLLETHEWVGQREFETFEVSTLEHIVKGLYPAIQIDQIEPASGKERGLLGSIVFVRRTWLYVLTKLQAVGVTPHVSISHSNW